MKKISAEHSKFSRATQFFRSAADWIEDEGVSKNFINAWVFRHQRLGWIVSLTPMTIRLVGPLDKNLPKQAVDYSQVEFGQNQIAIGGFTLYVAGGR